MYVDTRVNHITKDATSDQRVDSKTDRLFFYRRVHETYIMRLIIVGRDTTIGRNLVRKNQCRCGLFVFSDYVRLSATIPARYTRGDDTVQPVVTAHVPYGGFRGLAQESLVWGHGGVGRRPAKCIPRRLKVLTGPPPCSLYECETCGVMLLLTIIVIIICHGKLAQRCCTNCRDR